jgi:uncharacterized alpha/beta hydrolase family protein
LTASKGKRFIFIVIPIIVVVVIIVIIITTSATHEKNCSGEQNYHACNQREYDHGVSTEERRRFILSICRP